jgi:hypothetical protein
MGWRHAEIGHPVIPDQAPRSPGVRIIRRAFRDQQAAAGETRNTGAHRAHHPAHVAEEEKAIRRFEVPADDHVAGDHRTNETDMGPDAPLRLARRARRIEQDRWVFRLHFRGCDGSVLAGNDIAPPAVTSLVHRCFDVEAIATDDDDVLYRWRGLERHVEHRFKRRRHAAPPRATGGDHRLGFAMVQAGLNRAWAEPREQRHHNRAQLQGREESDEGLRQVRHVDRDHVAPGNAEVAQSLCQPANFMVEFGESQRAPLAFVLAFPDQECLVPHRGPAVPVNAVQDNVGGAADAPARPGLAARQVQHGVIGPVEPDIAEFKNFFHQPGGIGFRLRCKIVVILLVGRAQERR